MNSTCSGTSYCASPALAALYAPPRARVAQVFQTAPGWRGFGHAQRGAIVLNALVLVLIACVAAQVLRGYPGGRVEVLWAPLFCAAPLLSVLGLWPCRDWWLLRVLMLLTNLVWACAFGCFAIIVLAGLGTGMFSLEGALIIGAILGAGLLPPAAALWAQISQWRRG